MCSRESLLGPAGQILGREQFRWAPPQAHFLKILSKRLGERQKPRNTSSSSTAEHGAVPREGRDLLSPYRANILRAYKLCWHFFCKVSSTRERRAISPEVQHALSRASPLPVLPLPSSCPRTKDDEPELCRFHTPGVPSPAHTWWWSCLRA